MSDVQAEWVAALPPRMRAAIEREDAREAVAARQAAAEREDRAESWRSANLALYAEQASLRGEDISAMALARGEVRGRSIGDVLAEAARLGDAQDARDQSRASREADGRVHVIFGEPQIHHARSERKLQMFNRSRRFFEMKAAQRRAAEAETRSKNDYGFVCDYVDDRTGWS